MAVDDSPPFDLPAGHGTFDDERLSGAESLSMLAYAVRSADGLLLFLDYDGTLVPYAPTPDLAAPDEELFVLLERLASRNRTFVHIISGRAKETLEKWLGHLPVGLHAEHGLWSRPDPAAPWIALVDAPRAWKESVRPVLQRQVEGAPGSLLEEKSASLAFHYRLCDPLVGERSALELHAALERTLDLSTLQILPGEKVVEIRLRSVNKGMVVAPLLRTLPSPALVVAMGDDRTDEDLFGALPRNGIAVHVGESASRAPYRVRDAAATRAFLREVLEPLPIGDTPHDPGR